jgi:hypothetical protein
MQHRAVIEESNGSGSLPSFWSRRRLGNSVSAWTTAVNDVTKKDHPDDKEKTAFSTGQGLWRFTVMPIGLCNGPATFERIMKTDDVIVIGRTFRENLLNLRKVFQRFREARLKRNPKKCQLLQKEIR